MKNVQGFAFLCLLTATLIGESTSNSGNKNTAGNVWPVPSVSLPSTVFDSLEGEWEGVGEFSGQPATFRMKWDIVMNGTWANLEFASFAGAGDPSDLRPILQAEAFYRLSSAISSQGTWFDDRGATLPLAFDVGDSSLTVVWGEETTQQGRTTYRVESGDRIGVVDEILGSSGYGIFSRATYTRKINPHEHR